MTAGDWAQVDAVIAAARAELAKWDLGRSVGRRLRRSVLDSSRVRPGGRRKPLDHLCTRLAPRVQVLPVGGPMSNARWFASVTICSGVIGCVDVETDEVASAVIEACAAGEFTLGPYSVDNAQIAIPPACRHVEIKAWGDGGGPGWNPDPGGNALGGGGGGGYAHVTLENQQEGGATSLYMRIGHPAVLHQGGHGTSVRWVEPDGSPGPMIVVAGGGGGGGADDDDGTPYGGGAEQAAGRAGGSSPEPNQGCSGGGGGGGSATAPGKGGVGGGAWASNGSPGGPLIYESWDPSNNGGQPSWHGGGEGGGGYFGGGGGGGCSSYSPAGYWKFNGGGGGGGNYADGGGAPFEDAITKPGSGATPGNADDEDRCHQPGKCSAGQGAAPVFGEIGVPGRVVIRWW